MAFNAASTCTSCGEHAFFLGVDVHQNPALTVGKIHGRCTQQAHLLADGQHDLQRRDVYKRQTLNNIDEVLGFKLFYGAKGLKNIPKYSNFANVFICVVITCFAIHAMMKSRDVYKRQFQNSRSPFRSQSS